MSDLRAFFGPNAGYVLEMYEQYLADPASVDAETQAFFADFDPSAIAYTPGRAPATTAVAAPVQPAVDVLKATGAARLAKAIRSYGHLAAAQKFTGRT